MGNESFLAAKQRRALARVSELPIARTSPARASRRCAISPS